MQKIQYPDNIPAHIAIIMDGNGRWANERLLPRIAGHREGVKAVRKLTEFCGKIGVKYLTLYTFSTENWARPEAEVSSLMKLFVQSLQAEIDDLMENNVVLNAIGSHSKLSKTVREKLEAGCARTKNNSGLTLTLAFNYGGQEEILQATRRFAEDLQAGKVTYDALNTELFANYLYTADLPNPDLLVRTGGESRISNFLLWQIAYSEIYFTKTFWPAFDENALVAAINDYQQRERRFGKTGQQIKNG